jgi:hypothetical protein
MCEKNGSVNKKHKTKATQKSYTKKLHKKATQKSYTKS